MEQGYPLAFGPFHFDGPPGRLWQGEQAIALRPQSLAMLRYLVAHPGRLVTKAELRQHVSAGTHVSDTVLRVSVHEIRQALGDGAAANVLVDADGLARLVVNSAKLDPSSNGLEQSADRVDDQPDNDGEEDVRQDGLGQGHAP